MSGLRQMHVNFDPVEDRILLRITSGEPGNLDEFRFWLTRRIVRIMWKLFDQAVDTEAMTDPRVPQESAGALREFKQEAALAKADFTTPFKAEQASTPLGAAPQLVSKIQLRQQHGNHVLLLETFKGQIVNLALNTSLVHSFRKLLADQCLAAQWDLPVNMAPGKAAFLVEAPHTIN
jgi:hypothetical protein